MGRLDDKNLISYVQALYGPTDKKISQIITNYTPLLQDNYGKANDCTLTCITSILSKGSPQNTYKKVEEVALKYGYNGDDMGTNPFVIKKILDEITKTKSKRGYGKGIGYTWKKIKNLIGKNKPIILSLNNDGRNYYKNHSVTIVGWMEFNKTRFLIVADNWYTTYAYIDYEKLSLISSINYLE